MKSNNCGCLPRPQSKKQGFCLTPCFFRSTSHCPSGSRTRRFIFLGKHQSCRTGKTGRQALQRRQGRPGRTVLDFPLPLRRKGYAVSAVPAQITGSRRTVKAISHMPDTASSEGADHRENQYVDSFCLNHAKITPLSMKNIQKPGKTVLTSRMRHAIFASDEKNISV